MKSCDVGWGRGWKTEGRRQAACEVGARSDLTQCSEHATADEANCGAHNAPLEEFEPVSEDESEREAWPRMVVLRAIDSECVSSKSQTRRAEGGAAQVAPCGQAGTGAEARQTQGGLTIEKLHSPDQSQSQSDQ